jgi:hypothetical protein
MDQFDQSGQPGGDEICAKEIRFKGTHLVEIEAVLLWQALNDPDVLQYCIQGCSSVKKSGSDAFVATFGVRLGPLKKDFAGRLTIVDADPPSRYRLHSVLDAGPAGTLDGYADVFLTPLPESHTRLDYTARVAATGWISRLGRKLLGGAAQKYMDRFFARLVEKVQDES